MHTLIRLLELFARLLVRVFRINMTIIFFFNILAGFLDAIIWKWNSSNWKWGHSVAWLQPRTAEFLFFTRDVSKIIQSFIQQAGLYQRSQHLQLKTIYQPNRHMTSMRRDDIISTPVRRHYDVMCPLGSLAISAQPGWTLWYSQWEAYGCNMKELLKEHGCSGGSRTCHYKISNFPLSVSLNFWVSFSF